MDEHTLNSLLHGITPDLDAGRTTAPRPRGLLPWLTGPALALALGLGACAGTGQPPARTARTSSLEAHAGDEPDLPRRPPVPRAAERSPDPSDREAPTPPATDTRPPPRDTPVPPMDPPSPLGE